MVIFVSVGRLEQSSITLASPVDVSGQSAEPIDGCSSSSTVRISASEASKIGMLNVCVLDL